MHVQMQVQCLHQLLVDLVLDLALDFLLDGVDHSVIDFVDAIRVITDMEILVGQCVDGIIGTICLMLH